MQTTKSADGTTIAYETTGDGESLVAVHGSTATRHAWDPHLADAAELHAMVRRGRAASGDAEEYALEGEVEDVLAVLDETGGDRLFGHSFGGLCSLGAAERSTTDLEKLVLFEPAILVGEHQQYDAADRMADLLAAGGREAAMRLAFDEMAGAEDVEAFPTGRRSSSSRRLHSGSSLPSRRTSSPGSRRSRRRHSCSPPGTARPSFRTQPAKSPTSSPTRSSPRSSGHTGIENPAAVAEPVLELLQR